MKIIKDYIDSVYFNPILKEFLLSRDENEIKSIN